MKLRFTRLNDGRPCQNLFRRWPKGNSAVRSVGKVRVWTSRYVSVRSCVGCVKKRE